MRLAGKNELHRTLGIVHHGGQLFDVGQNQIGPLVGGEAAGKADGQRVRTEDPAQPLQHFRRLVAALGLLDRAVADKIQQPGLQVEMGFPEFAIVHVLNSLPDRRVGVVLLPARPQMAVVKTEHLRRQPGRNVHAVGDVPDGNLVFGLARIEPGPHMPGHLAMQRGDGIGAARQSQAQDGHAKVLILIAWVLPSQLHEFLLRDTQGFAHGAKMLLHQLGVKPVVAGGHGGVGGENRLAGNAADSMIKVDSLTLHAVANRFQHGEPAVAFIQVQNAGGDAHGFEGAETADAQQQFLANPDARVAAIEARGEFTVFGMVAFDVGVEEKQVAAPDLHAPDFGPDGAAAGLHLHRDGFAVRCRWRLPWASG